MMLVKKSLGAILTSLRREAGLTQPRVSELLAAEGVDIKPAGISKWEKDMTIPPLLPVKVAMTSVTP